MFSKKKQRNFWAWNVIMVMILCFFLGQNRNGDYLSLWLLVILVILKILLFLKFLIVNVLQNLDSSNS